VPRLRDLEKRGAANGLEGLRWLDGHEMREIEPHVGGVAALRVPQEGIVDYAAVCDALAARLLGARRARGYRRPREPAALARRDVDRGNHRRRVPSRFSDQLRRPALRPRRPTGGRAARHTHRALPRRVLQAAPERQHLVRNLIYPVPDPRFPFLGVHFTRLIHGGIEAGPNAVLAFARKATARPISTPATWPTRSRISACGASCDVIPPCAGSSCGAPSPPVVLPFAPASGARNPARRPRYRRLRRTRAGHCAGRRVGSGLPLHRAAPCAPRAQRAQPRRHGGAGHRSGDRRHGGAAAAG